MKRIVACVALLFVSASWMPAPAGEVGIFTGTVNWITKEAADAEAEICEARLTGAGVDVQWFALPTDDAFIAEWVEDHTNDGETDVLILFGWLPPTLYPPPNAEPEGSILEAFIESEDGDAIINHADWMFYVSAVDGVPTNNAAAGLQNIMDVPGVTMGGPDNSAMTVTEEGREIAPSLTDFSTDRPLHINTLGGEWFVEVALAQNADGSLADPVIVRDGSRGRIIPMYQSNQQADPKGAVAAELIAWLFEVELEPTRVGITGPGSAVANSASLLTVSTADDSGTPTPTLAGATIELASDSGSGAFDVARNGAFDGSVTSVEIPPGGMSATVYYRDGDAGTPTITGSADELDDGTFSLTILEDLSEGPGEVAIYTGNVGWITPAAAEAQAQICVDKLDILGIDAVWYDQPTQAMDLAMWVDGATDNGLTDVLVLYGNLPDSIYGAGNAEPDGSFAEAFIESTDGDLIINHADYMFYVSSGSPNNEVGGLQNMMDIPAITMWGNNDPMTVTPDGAAISPSLTDFLSDRPLHLDQLADEWYVEVALAQNPTGTLGDPVIVRDGNRGRLAPIFQADNQDDPKGSVCAEVIAWLFGVELLSAEQVGIVGATGAWGGDPLALSVQLQDETGSPSRVLNDTVVSLGTTSGTGAFDVAADGPFDGSIASVTVLAGESSAEVYYRDETVGTHTLSVTADGLTDGALDVTIFERSFADPGEVAIYTATTSRIVAGAADAQAEICANSLTALDVGVQRFTASGDDPQLTEWVDEHTNDGRLDVLILFGSFPEAIYPADNASPEESYAELFIESPDGDTIINVGDWMFYVSSGVNNGPDGLRNMMDVPAANMAGFNDTPMTVTEEGRTIAPSLGDFLTDRPMHLTTLGGDWLVEAVLAQSADGTLADPVILRDGDAGRLIPLYQTNSQIDPKGTVAAEVIAWLYGAAIEPTQLGLSGFTTTATDTPVRLTVELTDAGGAPRPLDADLTVQIEYDSPSAVIDTAFDGAFDGSVVSVDIPAGETSARFFFMDSEEGDVTITASVGGEPALDDGQITLNVVLDESGEGGEVAIYTGNVNWIDPLMASDEAQICVNELNDRGIANTWYTDPLEAVELADWMIASTGNGEVDVLVIYGYFPNEIYGAGNAEPEGSIAEAFIESTDGDAIINHADWMFYVSGVDGVPTNNGVLGLENMMDIPGVTMAGFNDMQVTVTEEGSVIAPSLTDFFTDRPLHLNTLAGEWFVEAALAEGANTQLAEPVIVRDGNRGRLIPVHQTANQDDPKGVVAAEIIAWLFGEVIVEGEQFVRGDCNGDGNVTGQVGDAIFVLNYNFLGGPAPSCMAACDANGDGAVVGQVGDAIYTLNFNFLGGPAIPAPFPDCGPLTTDGDRALGCETGSNGCN